MNRDKLYKILFWLLIIISIIFVISPILIDPVLARPGGGQSYSGGGGGGGGGGDGIAELIIFLLLSLPPEISIPLCIIIVIGYIIVKRKRKRNPVVSSAPTYQNRTQTIINTDYQVNQLKSADPNFSRVLFLEFVSNLYHKYYSLQGKKDFSNLTPYLSENIIAQVKNQTVQREINEIVIGSIYISNVQAYQDLTAVSVDIDSNYTITVGGKGTRYIITERWLLNRKAGVISKEPENMRKLSCPNCGAPANFTDAGQCQHCQTFINPGDMQWFLKDRKILSQQSFQTNSLLTYAEEVGTDFPTIFQQGLQAGLQQFTSAHAVEWGSYWQTFQNNTVRPYFLEIYSAWTRQRWDEVRHLTGDRLWESNNFWIEAYKKQGLINKLDNINISKIDLAKIETDKFYEAITVRIFANCFDYVTDRSGKVMAGSNKRARYFSEYWSFIRRSGVENESFDLKKCPNCGAPADKMGQAGECQYCGSKITTGEFSWVLSVITQDEAYKG